MKENSLVVPGIGLVVGVAIGVVGASLLWGKPDSAVYQILIAVGRHSSEEKADSVLVAEADPEENPAVGEPAEVVPVDPDEQMIALMDEHLAHHADPQKPAGVRGHPDQVIRSLSADDAWTLIRDGTPVARKQVATSQRLLFQLGRLALLHDYMDEARVLLTDASEKGSAAAHAYLGEMLLAKDDAKGAAEHFQQAVDGGFKPAAANLAQATMLLKQRSLNFDNFKHPALLRALAQGNFASFNETEITRLGALICIQQMAEAINEAGSYMLNMGDPQQQLIEIDPGLAARAGLEASRGIMNYASRPEVMVNYFKALGNMLVDLSQNGPAAITNSSLLTNQVDLEVLKQESLVDGKLLAASYRSGAKEEVGTIYRNMRKFVYRE